MYQPKLLELTNFGSHKHTVLNFPEHQTTLIQGINETNQGQKSNGSGKSFLIEGLSYALLGSSLRNIKDKELVMDSEKEAIIRLVLFNPVLDQTLDITRKIYSNTKSGELIIEGETNITSVNEGNKLILERLGLSREDVLNYFLLSKERYTSFLVSSDTSKKELINRFSKADRINTAIESCDYDIKDYQIKVTSLENKIESNKVLITSLEAARGVNNTEAIQTLKKENEALSAQINGLETDITKQGYYKERHAKSVQVNTELVKSIDIDKVKASIKEYEGFIDEIERHFTNEVTCPNCQHKFSLKDEKYNLEEAKQLYPVVVESLADLKAERDLKLDDLDKAEKELKKSKNDLQECEMQIRGLSTDLANLKRTIQSNLVTIEKLSRVSDNKGEIESFKQKNSELEKELIEYKEKLSTANEALLRFKRFKGFVANKSLTNIQAHTNFFLERLNSDLQIEIEGYTPINNGKELREKIYTKVLREGKEASFARFSGGEKSRIEVAIILAMQQIMNNVSEGKGLSLLVLDEVVESIDSEGLTSLLKSLNLLKLNVLIITHATIESSYENTLTVKKVNGSSEIIF